MRETTALGAAIAAGLAAGLWHNFAELRDINRSGGAVFEPQVPRQDSAEKFGQWEKAVQMSRGWVGSQSAKQEDADSLKNETYAPVKDHDLPPPKVTQILHNSVISDVAKSSTYTRAVKERNHISVKEIEVPSLPVQTALGSVLGDLDDAEEEDLFLELRKVEILQRLRKLRKRQSDCY
jgi:Glycerol kinase